MLSAALLVGLLFGGLATLQAQINIIEPMALARLLDSRSPPLLLDVRGREAYLQGSLPGALDAGIDPAGFLPDGRGGEVVLISKAGITVDSISLADWLTRLADFNFRVIILKGGFAAWRAAGLPVERHASSFTRPGTVPFVIPRGLCEPGEPAQIYE